jgi:hypothetical protein
MASWAPATSLRRVITFEDDRPPRGRGLPDAIHRRQRPFRVGEIVCMGGRSTRQDGLAVLEVA